MDPGGYWYSLDILKYLRRVCNIQNGFTKICETRKVNITNEGNMNEKAGDTAGSTLAWNQQNSSSPGIFSISPVFFLLCLYTVTLGRNLLTISCLNIQTKKERKYHLFHLLRIYLLSTSIHPPELKPEMAFLPRQSSNFCWKECKLAFASMD